MSQSPFAANDHVLVVDDEPFIRNIVARLLREIGAPEIEFAKNGAEAIQTLSEVGTERFRLVVSDINMPTLGGLELLKQVRIGETKAKHSIPFILLTGASDQAMVAAALDLGVDSFIVKPVSKATLEARVRRALSTDRREISPPAEYKSVRTTPAPQIQRKNEEEEGGVVVAMADITPGSVLAAPIRTKTGTLLLAAGATLTSALLKKIGDLVEAEMHDGILRVKIPQEKKSA
jgi:PleD family two-component response regulator